MLVGFANACKLEWSWSTFRAVRSIIVQLTFSWSLVIDHYNFYVYTSKLVFAGRKCLSRVRHAGPPDIEDGSFVEMFGDCPVESQQKFFDPAESALQSSTKLTFQRQPQGDLPYGMPRDIGPSGASLFCNIEDRRSGRLEATAALFSHPTFSPASSYSKSLVETCGQIRPRNTLLYPTDQPLALEHATNSGSGYSSMSSTPTSALQKHKLNSELEEFATRSGPSVHIEVHNDLLQRFSASKISNSYLSNPTGFSNKDLLQLPVSKGNTSASIGIHQSKFSNIFDFFKIVAEAKSSDRQSNQQIAQPRDPRIMQQIGQTNITHHLIVTPSQSEHYSLDITSISICSGVVCFSFSIELNWIYIVVTL